MKPTRAVWLAVSLALIYGFLLGMSVAVEGFWLHPASALFGCFGVVVLTATVNRATRR